MTRPRFGTFTGGIDLPDDKDATIDSPIEAVGRLDRLRVPLSPVQAPPARPTVRPGQYVSRGEKLAEAEAGDGQVDIFAPLAGQVAGFCKVMLPQYPAGWRRSEAIELTDLDTVRDIGPVTEIFNWQSADKHSVRLRIAEGGLTTFSRSIASLADYIASARQAKVDTLIANVMENTPFITSDHRLLAEYGGEVVRGLAILARATGATNVILAVDHRRTDAYRGAVAPARFYGIHSISLAHKYPIGAEAMLIKVLTRRRAGPGRSGLDVGVAVTDAATCRATYRWVACGELPTARVVTVAGSQVARPANLLVPFGAGADEVFALTGTDTEGGLIYGSAMTGRQVVGGVVISHGANALLGLEPQRLTTPTPCIRCGWCSDNCPARLNVAALNDDFELGRPAAARRHGAMACIDCGICSYVCPARLPLMQRVGLLKEAILEEIPKADLT